MQDFRSRQNMWNLTRYALSFFRVNAIPFWDMTNTNNLVTSSDKNWCLSTDDQSIMVVYLSEGGSASVNLASPAANTVYSVHWYNPRTGGALLDGSVSQLEAGSAKEPLGSPPDSSNGDWVVLLKAVATQPVPAPSSTPTKKPTALPTGKPTPMPIVPSPPDSFEMRINCGGNTYVDTDGNTWEEDSYFNLGYTKNRNRFNIIGTQDDPLYQTERSDDTGATISYEIPVPSAGEYEVTILMAEIYFDTEGTRVFDVIVEDQDFAKGLDIVEQVGGNFMPLEISKTLVVADGFVSIDLNPVVENPKISAIYIRQTSSGTLSPTSSPTSSPTAGPTSTPTAGPTSTPTSSEQTASPVASPVATPPTVLLINCGGDEYTDSNGDVWQPDQFFSIGYTKDRSRFDIGGTPGELILAGNLML